MIKMIIKLNLSNNGALNKTILFAIIIRLIVLIIIALSGSWESSFINQDNGVTDDFKYEVGAELFVQNASSPFDVRTFAWAFNSVDSSDWTGHHLNNPISYSVLWYLIVCTLVWITKTKYSIRLFNILLAAITIRYIYNFAEKTWGDRVADKSVKLFAYLPYPIIFSCFGYKEELVLFCTFYLLSKSVDYRNNEKLGISGILKMLLVAVLLLGIRSGISLILFAVCLAIMFIPDPRTGVKITVKRILPFAVMLVVAVFAFVMFGGALTYKASQYIGEGRGGADTISLLMVNNIKDIWKLPLSYMYSIIMPISLFKPLDSWLSLIDNVNIIMVPISVGSILYMVLRKKNDSIVYWGTLGYYLIYVIASLNIFRQYASLLPLNLIFYAAFVTEATAQEKKVFYILSCLMVFVLVVFYLVKL